MTVKHIIYLNGDIHYQSENGQQAMTYWESIYKADWFHKEYNVKTLKYVETDGHLIQIKGEI